MNQKIKCAIYARVSTEKQGDSMENQISQALEYIKRMGDEYDSEDIIVFQDDAVSGYYTSVFDRKAMKEAIAKAKNNEFKLLVFKEVSRVGRDKQENPAIIGTFEQNGVRVIAINDNYDSLNKDNITFDILSVLSEQESKKISVRVSSARKQKANRGQWNGEPPFGYIVNPETKHLEIHEEFGKIPPIVFELYVDKAMGTFKIADYLNKKGMLTKKGNRWSRETINRMIKNQAYIGQVAYGTRRNVLQREYDDSGKMSKKKVQIKIDRREWQIVENAHPSLISDELFYKAQKIINSRNHERSPRRAYHPLTGVLYCGKCGQGMVCQKRSNEKKNYRYYICKTYHKYGREACDQTNINADKIEEDIIIDIKTLAINIPVEQLSITSNRKKDIIKLKQELRSSQIKIAKLTRDQTDIFDQRDLFPEESYRKRMLEIKDEIENIKETEIIIGKQIESVEDKISESSSFRYIIQEIKELDVDDTERIRAVIHEVVEKITVKEDGLVVEYNYDFS